MLIGFMGIKGSGKDTCADHLVKEYGFVKKSFADPLKKACKELFLFSDEQLYGTQEQKETPDSKWFGCSPRKALQYVGTDLLRNNLNNIMPGLNNDIFTHHFKLWYENAKATNPDVRVVMADVRFQNEINLIQSLGGIVIKIDRPSVLTNDMHPSEMELQGITTFDYLIENTSTLENLISSVEKII